MMQGKQRIGIFLSGRPGHREVGLRQGEAIAAALSRLGHQGMPLFLDRDMDLLVRQADISCGFLALQGRHGEDGCVQGFLELLGIPYTGSGVLAAALASNRIKTKEVLRLHNLPTAAGYVFDGTSGDSVADMHGQFGFPVTVRSVRERLPFADCVAFDELELESAIEEILRSDDEALIERHLQGRTVEVGVLDGEPLAALEMMRPGVGPVLATARSGGASVPCRLPAERLRSLLRLATQAYETLGCAGAATVQIQVSEKGNEIVREVDTMPVLTATSPLPRMAKMAGIGFAELVGRLLRGAGLRAQGRKDNRRQVQVGFGGAERRADHAVTAH